MTDETSAPAGGDDTTLVATAPADTPAELSAEDAGRALAELRWKRDNHEKAAESATTATAANESAQAGTASDEEMTVEDTETDPEVPAIDPPRSWSKDAHERWSRLDRETQEFLASRDSEDQKAIKRSLQEAAEARKAAEAERVSVEQVRKNYEAKLPALVQTLETALQNDFADIQTFADVRIMQRDDPFRYQQWDLRQKELAVVNQERRETELRQTHERQSSWAKFVQDESAAFAEDEPAFKAKETEYTKKAAALLGDLGFSGSELNKLATGEDKISLYDRRLQKLLFKAIRLDEIKSAPAKAVPKAVPPVQRPGAAPPKGAQATERIQALQKQFEREPSVENATALRLARLRRA